MASSKRSSRRGFTLIEALLFLAVSSILVVIVLTTMGTRIRNTRFSAGMNDLAENITSEFSATNFGRLKTSSYNCRVDPSTNGLIVGDDPTSATRGTQSDCIVIGKVAGIREDRVHYYDVLARRQPLPGIDCTGLKGIIDCYKPRATMFISFDNSETGGSVSLALNDREYVYKNGIRNTRFQHLAFGSIQNPSGPERYQFFWRGTGPEMALVFNPDGSATISSSSVPYDYVDGRNGHACFELDGRKGALVFDVQRVAPEVVMGTGEECP